MEMEQNIEKCITSLFDTIQAENEKESRRLLGDAIGYAKSSQYGLDNPEDFNVFIGWKLRNAVEMLANELHAPTTCKDKQKPNFIYGNYSFLKSNIEKLCVSKEGMSCSADKSRYILRMYLEYSLTGVIPEDNLEKSQYWKPRFGDNILWMAFCDGLYRLHSGQPEDYLIAYSDLIKSEIKKFKHTQHQWFIEFNDGQIISYRISWDDDTKNPTEYVDKGDYYPIAESLLKDRKYEVCTAKDDKRLIFPEDYVKVPKSDIKRIYKESRDVIL